MSDTPLAIGIDFGGTSVKIGVVYRGNIIDQAPPIATGDFEGAEPLIQAILRTVEELRARHPKVAAIGVGVPGFVNFKTGTIYNLTNVEGWKNIALRDRLTEETELPCIVENDANCMTYAEWKRGAGKGMHNLVALTLGTGVGGGLIVEDKLIRGSQYGAGEVGQTSIDYRGRIGNYGNRGALESYIGNNELAADALQRYKEAGISKTLTECTPLALAQAAHRGEEVAKQIWEDTGEMLASAIMNLCWILNPQGIIIGGGVAKAGDLLFEPLQKHLLAQLSGPFREHLQILPARFGNEAGMIGAAALALVEAGHDIDDK